MEDSHKGYRYNIGEEGSIEIHKGVQAGVQRVSMISFNAIRELQMDVEKQVRKNCFAL